MTSFDFIVVGAGSAGCALAARLSESGRHQVLLLEGGGPDSNPWIRVPLGVGKLLTNERYAWKFETEPQQGLLGQRIYWPRGKMLGGSSSLNGMAYVWGDPAEFDDWAAGGLKGWDIASLRPYFRRMESNPYTTRDDRGHDGPMRITDRARRETDVLSDAFVQACEQAGIPPTEDYNAGRYEGVRYLEQTAYEGTRWNTARGYLRPARSRPNLRIVTGALVHRVLFEKRRAVGVEYSLPDGSMQRARTRGEVLLSAGAIQSPQLLELSGIGHPEVLARHGIDVVQPLPAVGENMTDHLQLRRTYRTDVPITINDVMRNPVRRMVTGLQYLLTRRGLMANTSSTAHAITRTSVANGRADVMIRIYHISGKDRYSRSPGAGIDPFSGFSIGGFKLYPKSVGHLHIVSTDPRQAPRIEPNYFAHEEDRATAVAMLRLIDRIARQPAFTPRIVGEIRPGPECASDAALLEYAKECGQTAWHTVGTCRMGLDAASSVVDARLRVHGVGGLRVIDASVMPTIASSNTNAPAIMIGEKGADMVLEEAAS